MGDGVIPGAHPAFRLRRGTMATFPQYPGYHVFLLRLWLVDEQGSIQWRAFLENPASGERLGFSSLEQLVAYLREQTFAGRETVDPDVPV